MSDAVASLTAALADRYRIERELGAGGMATVYLAEDLKHKRRVAIKVLKPELAAAIGADRFLAEIRTTASLQHPNILPLFDSGQIDACLFYVMPYVDGESLRDRLTRERQLPVADAIAIATDIAGALDHAHHEQVIHRDIKPENVMLKDGRALVADFGIALAASRAGSERMTDTGLALGTPHYMSPEQAMGERTLTARSDVYSLGCVTYEMLVGEPPFTGPTIQGIVARLMTEEPRSPSRQRRSVPPAAERAVLRSLEKLPADRFATAGEFARALVADTGQSRDAIEGRRRTTRVPLAAAAVLVIAALIGAVVWGWHRPQSREQEAAPTARLVIPLPPDRLLSQWGRELDISPDGTDLVYVGISDGRPLLLLRPLADSGAHELAGTDGAHGPFFSPDGRWIGFVANGKLQKIPRSGGAAIVLADAPGAWGGAQWRTDGSILYSAGNALQAVPEAGGTPHRIPVRTRAVRVRWPSMLPGGTQALIALDTSIAVLNVASGETRELLRGRQAVYLPTGHLLYDATEGHMRVAPFDPVRRIVTGTPSPAFDAFRTPGDGATQFAVSSNGTLVYVPGGFNRSLSLVDQRGLETPLPLPPRGYRFPRFAPDGQRVALTVDPRPSRIWVLDLQRMSAVPVTEGEGSRIVAVWSPDGRGLVYALGTGPVVQSPLGSAEVPALVRAHQSGRQFYTTDWSGGHGLLAEWFDSSGGGIVGYRLGDSGVTKVITTPGRDRQGRFSPDGRWIAFTSDLSGVNEVYVQSAEGGEAILVSRNGGSEPRWAADGRAIFYRRNSWIMRVRVRAGAGFEVTEPPRNLFSGSYDFSQDDNWDVSRDGRFIMVRSDPASVGRLMVVLNWFGELKKGPFPAEARTR